MESNFTITDGIFLVQGAHTLDLHNHFNFTGFEYSISHRKLSLHWRKSTNHGARDDDPKYVTIFYQNVSEFRFLPRDEDLPFTEDDCLSGFGYWTDEDWVEGLILLDSDQEPDSTWRTALEFMSGATMIIKAEMAELEIKNKE